MEKQSTPLLSKEETTPENHISTEGGIWVLACMFGWIGWFIGACLIRKTPGQSVAGASGFLVGAGITVIFLGLTSGFVVVGACVGGAAAVAGIIGTVYWLTFRDAKKPTGGELA